MGVLIAPPGQPRPLKEGEFASASVPNVVSFRLQDIAPPSPLYVQRDDVLLLEVTTPTFADNITLSARLLLAAPPRAGQPDSPPSLPGEVSRSSLGGSPIVTIQATIASPVSGLLTRRLIPLAEGYLLSAAVISNLRNARGNTWVRLWIARGPIVIPLPVANMLIADYVTVSAPIGWPGGRQLFPTDGPGNLRTVTVTAPAAGSDWNTSVPTSTRWRISSFTARLATSAAVANRIVRVQLRDAGSGQNYFQSPPSQVIPASTTAFVSVAPGQITSTTDVFTVNVGLPATTYLPSGDSIFISTLSLQAADQWGLITLLVEEWVDLN